MAEIKFDVARMKEVNSRLNEITEQLTSSASGNGDEITNITSNITGEEVIEILKKYQETNEHIIKQTQSQITELQEYLQQQIINYTATEQAASESLSDIQNMLNGLEG